MAVYTLAFFGFMPIGSLLTGTVAASVGVPLTVVIGASGTLACAGAIALAVPSLRKDV